jgi:hypothetical protein
VSLPDPAARPLLAVDEVVELLRGADGRPMFGRSTLFDALRRGDVPGRRCIGRRVFVSTAELAEWLGLSAPARGSVGEVVEIGTRARAN